MAKTMLDEYGVANEKTHELPRVSREVGELLGRLGQDLIWLEAYAPHMAQKVDALLLELAHRFPHCGKCFHRNPYKKER